jgi:hypothetical protein
LLLYGPISNLESCMENAITQSARSACEAQYEEDTVDLMERYGVPRPD